MPRNRTRKGDEIRRFLLEQVGEHPADLVNVAGEHFGISRQAVGRYVRQLMSDGYLEATGATRTRRYALRTLVHKTTQLNLEGLQEDAVWRSEVSDSLESLPVNVVHIWQYGFTEMLNNAIDHSGGITVVIQLTQNAIATRMAIMDDGVGIFRKIKTECGLEDERHAVLELAKGKLTTDPERHTGEGIFFASRMFDDFAILSGDVYFTHKHEREEDWIMERSKPERGTAVFLGLGNHASRKMNDVFERFASEEEDYGFTKTVVPVWMARQGEEQLVSRSQARRLLARVDRFNTVLFDFQGVDTAGRAFIDEIFRVFARAHPNILLMPINENAGIGRLIAVARSSNPT